MSVCKKCLATENTEPFEKNICRLSRHHPTGAGVASTLNSSLPQTSSRDTIPEFGMSQLTSVVAHVTLTSYGNRAFGASFAFTEGNS